MNQYITLIGSVKGEGNTLSKFTTRLPESLSLRKDRHEIGLAEIIFPISAQNFAKGGKYTIILPDGTSHKYYLRSGHYPNGSVLAEGLTRKEAKKYAYFDFMTENQHMRIIVQKGVDRVEIDDDLAYALGFTETVFTATTEAKHVVDKLNQQSIVYIYCDAVTPNIVGDTRAPLLQCVSIEGELGEIRRVSFNPIRYLEPMYENIDQITIELVNERGVPIDFSFGSVILVLHIKDKF